MKFLNRFRNAALIATLALASVFGSLNAHAASLTDTLESALIGHLFRGTAYTAPTTWYVGLMTTACTDSAAGTEVTGGAYARVGVASGTGTWAAVSAGNGTTSNVNAINFTTPSASWGTVTHFGLWDAASAGNLLICQALTASKTINSGDTVSFAAGALTIQIDN